jgi:GNAT superfamily N-acetyltransferase
MQQWGSEPWSTMPRRIAQVTEACALPGAWVAQNEQGDVRAFLALGESMPYVPAPTGPELYVRVLVASRDVRVRGIGRRLMAFADEQARAAGVDHLRVDCYAGGSGDLVRFYESCGIRASRRSTWTAGQACCWEGRSTRLRHSVAACVQETIHRFGARVGS